MSRQVLEALPELLGAHGRLVMATIVSAIGSTPRETSARMLILPDATTRFTVGGGKFESLVIAEARRLLSEGGLPFTREYPFTPEAFGAVCGGKAVVLFELLERAPRLVVVGAGHCGRALARGAVLAGYDVTVADERAEQLDPAAFPEGVALVKVAADYSDLPLPGPETAVALVSRGHVTDGLALRRLRGTPLAYLGMMGSNAKKKALFGELRAEGWDEAELARVVTPIGLPIGARSPEEIAISILAQLVERRRGRGEGVANTALERRAKESDRRLTRVLQSMPAMVAAWDENGCPVFWNRECELVTGYGAAEVLEKPGLMERLYPDPGHRAAVDEQRRQGGEYRVLESELVARDGSRRSVAWSGVADSIPVPGWHTWAVGVDVTDRKKADELRHALTARETLLRELHHRVKNNLQAVTSLFALHAASVKDPAARSLLRESENRVHAMAAVQDALGPEAELGKQPLRSYVFRLCDHLLRSYGVDGHRVEISLDVEELRLTLDQAAAFAVLLNELVANALRHAFPEGRRGRITVRVLREGGSIALRVSDDGVGLPPELDPMTTDSLGLRLVRSMARQLDGAVLAEREGGTTMTVTFPARDPETVGA